MKVLITGASSKLGGEIALCFALAGAKLALAYDRGGKKVEALAHELKHIGCAAFPIGADLSNEKACESLVECASKTLGGLDAIIHSAADFSATKFEKTTKKDFEKFLEVNALSAFFIGRAAKKIMCKKGGSVVLISDVASKHPYGEFIPYCTSKAALDSITVALAKKLAPKITVNAISPYVISCGDPKCKDEARLAKKTLLENAQSATDIATLAIWLATQRSTTGKIFDLDGGRFV